MSPPGVRTRPDCQVSLATRQAALSAVLSVGPRAIVAALADDGSLIALPESFPLAGHRALPVPQTHETLLNVVVPADRIAAVAAWEHARANGIGVAAVRAIRDPSVPLTLSIIDSRDVHGVWIAILTRSTEDAEDVTLSGPLAVPSRPRQGTLSKTMTGIITAVDEQASAMLGWTPAQMLGRRSTEFLHPDDHDRAVAGWMALLSSLCSQRVRVRHRCADGTFLWVEVEHVHNGAEDPDAVEVTAHICDISDEMAAHEAIRRREQLFSRLAESLPTGVLQCAQDGTIVYANARLCRILQAGTPSTTSELFTHVMPADRDAAEQALDAALRLGVDAELEIEVRPAGARGSRRCLLTIAAIDDREGQQGALLCVSDVTESARMREELRKRASHDALTGCLNRSAVITALEYLLCAAAPEGPVVIYIDVDGFKAINDSHGHATGDEVLVGLARRLQQIAREDDLVGRLGGDEFLLVCRRGPMPAGAARLAERVRQTLNQPFAASAGTIDIQASIGVAWPQNGASAHTVIASADAAMYQSKRLRRGEPVLFTSLDR